MEATPAFDASRPSPIRLWGFVLAAFGALIAGVGALLAWVTVGIANRQQLDSRSLGTDLVEGKLALAGAIAMLIAMLASRMVRTARARVVAEWVEIVSGALIAAVAASFLLTASSRHGAIDSDLITALARAGGVTPSELVTKLGAFTQVGLGPYLALVGGVLGLAGGIVGLAWAARVRQVDRRNA